MGLTKSHHVTMKGGFPLFLFSFMLSLFHVSVQANSSCQPDQITIKDPKTGSIQCQGCLKCAPGEGLSVNCGDVITPSKPVQCKPCVLGKTYSAFLEAGGCKDCRNCDKYRETTKACTVTSKAECGRCKPGAYAEGMLGVCKPCSPCCYDDKDIIIPECQVPGVPTGMQCSYLRSHKCSVLVTSRKSTAPSTLQPHRSTTQWGSSSSTTSTKVISSSSKPAVNLIEENSPNVGSIAGSVVGTFSAVITILVIVCRKVMRKRRKALSMRIGVVTVENGAGQTQNQEQENDEEDEQVDREQTDDRVFLPNRDLYEESPLPHPTQEEAGDKSPEKKGVQETTSPLSGQNSLVSDSKLDGSVVKQYTKSSKKQVFSLPNVVTKTTTVTMVKVTDEKVTTV